MEVNLNSQVNSDRWGHSLIKRKKTENSPNGVRQDTETSLFCGAKNSV